MTLKDLKIFVSSTYLDLKEAREKIIKFLKVLDSDILHMEVFGSDETKPKDFVLAQVRKSNLFIGVYAERYGTIDEESGLSLTELEYHEAFKLFSQDKIKGILLYSLASDASWNISFIDRDPTKVEKLQTFKSLIGSRHTLTFFRDIEELPFNILSDTIRKLEIGVDKFFPKRELDTPYYKTSLTRPVGMEFFSVDLAALFYGRQQETEYLTAQVINHHFSLLIGISGIGKTSLLNAAIIPYFNSINWLTVIIRPLTNPKENLKHFLWNSFFSTPLPLQFELCDVIQALLTTFNDKKLLIIIDQFEEVLYASKKEDQIHYIISQFTQLYQTPSRNIHLLISYRGDVESEIGIVWQKVSGAPDGLPRFYLQSLAKEAAKMTLKNSFENLQLSFSTDLADQIIEDLQIESESNGYSGIFPPFLQMTIAGLFDKGSQGKVTETLYNELGGAKSMIAGYLFTQLEYLGANKEEGKKILAALVSNYGSKTQKTLVEIIDVSEINEDITKNVLEQLLSLRLVRVVADGYEITHDLLAKQIIQTLVSEEELALRKFKHLIESKTAVFESTGTLFSLPEILVLYSLREKLKLNDQNTTLILKSSLHTNCPVSFWLQTRSLDKDRTDIQFIIQSLQYDLNLLSNSRRVDNIKVEAPKWETNLTEQQLISLSRRDNEIDTIRFYYGATEYLETLPDSDKIKLIKSSRRWQQLLGVVHLAHQLNEQNAHLLRQIALNSKYPSKLKAIALKGYLNYAVATNKIHEFATVLAEYNGAYWDFVYSDVKGRVDSAVIMDTIKVQRQRLDSSYMKFSFLLANSGGSTMKIDLTSIFTDDNFFAEVLAEEHIRIFLEQATAKDFVPFVEFIESTTKTLQIDYKAYLHEAAADIVTDDHYLFLRNRIVNLLDNRHNSNYIITEVKGNDYFLKWILFTAFCRICKASDKDLLFESLDYYLYTVRLAAAQAIYKHGEKNDIDNILKVLNQEVETRGSRNEQLLTLRFLDIKFYYSKIKEYLWAQYEGFLDEGNIPL